MQQEPSESAQEWRIALYKKQSTAATHARSESGEDRASWEPTSRSQTLSDEFTK